MEEWVNVSGTISLIIQIIIFIASIYTIQLQLPPNHLILGKILMVENVVQLIEIVFYGWLMFSVLKPEGEITWVRYVDWVFTTPAMLFSLVCFMLYIDSDNKEITLANIWESKSQPLIIIFVANFLMLLFGFLAELKIGNYLLNMILGFIAFFVSFWTIFTDFMGTSLVNKVLFYSTFVLWLLYGVAALMSYHSKNIFYNILDIFSKNIMALALVLYIHYILNTEPFCS
mgnify:FL=1|tara:strand:- start:508 stop:1194 length:687 start_codon:yes stop_codon:yes gene_type:complete